MIWEIGTDEAASKGRDNALEFASVGSTTTTFSRILGWGSSYPTPGNTLFLPGYLNNGLTFKQVCTANGYGCQNFFRDFRTTGALNFVVTSPNQTCTDLTLTYHRHGTETDDIIVEVGDSSVTIQNLGMLEGVGTTHQIPIPLNIFGVEVLRVTIQYQGGGNANGHFIDYIRMDADCETTLPPPFPPGI